MFRSYEPRPVIGGAAAERLLHPPNMVSIASYPTFFPVCKAPFFHSQCKRMVANNAHALRERNRNESTHTAISPCCIFTDVLAQEAFGSLYRRWCRLPLHVVRYCIGRLRCGSFRDRVASPIDSPRAGRKGGVREHFLWLNSLPGSRWRSTLLTVTCHKSLCTPLSSTPAQHGRLFSRRLSSQRA